MSHSKNPNLSHFFSFVYQAAGRPIQQPPIRSSSTDANSPSREKQHVSFSTVKNNNSPSSKPKPPELIKHEDQKQSPQLKSSLDKSQNIPAQIEDKSTKAEQHVRAKDSEQAKILEKNEEKSQKEERKVAESEVKIGDSNDLSRQIKYEDKDNMSKNVPQKIETGNKNIQSMDPNRIKGETEKDIKASATIKKSEVKEENKDTENIKDRQEKIEYKKTSSQHMMHSTELEAMKEVKIKETLRESIDKNSNKDHGQTEFKERKNLSDEKKNEKEKEGDNKEKAKVPERGATDHNEMLIEKKSKDLKQEENKKPENKIKDPIPDKIAEKDIKSMDPADQFKVSHEKEKAGDVKESLKESGELGVTGQEKESNKRELFVQTNNTSNTVIVQRTLETLSTQEELSVQMDAKNTISTIARQRDNRSLTPNRYYGGSFKKTELIYNNKNKLSKFEDIEKKVKEYRERNPYPCYEFIRSKGVISRKDGLPGLQYKRPKPQPPQSKSKENSFIEQRRASLLKETSSRHLLFQEEKEQKEKTIHVEPPEENTRRTNIMEGNTKPGKIKLEPLPKPSVEQVKKEIEKPVVVHQRSSSHEVNEQRKSPIKKLQALKPLPLRRMASQEKETSSDCSVTDIRQLTEEDRKGQSLLKDNPLSSIKERIRVKKISKGEKEKLEKLANIKNVYGMEDLNKKLEALLNPNKMKSSISTIQNPQRSASVVVDGGGNITTRTSQLSLIANKGAKSIDVSRENSKDADSYNETLKRDYKTKQTGTSEFLSPDTEIRRYTANDVSIADNSFREQTISDKQYLDLNSSVLDKRSSSFSRPTEIDKYGLKKDLHPYIKPERYLNIQESVKRTARTESGARATNLSFQNLAKDTSKISNNDSQSIILQQNTTQGSTRGKGVIFGKAYREILVQEKSKSPGPAKYEVPDAKVMRGARFGTQRRSLKFGFPTLKDVNGVKF